jgi:hypothetical protein
MGFIQNIINSFDIRKKTAKKVDDPAGERSLSTELYQPGGFGMSVKLFNVKPFHEMVIYQLKMMIISIFSEVEFEYTGNGNKFYFENFVKFFNDYAIKVYNQLFNIGYVVVVWDNSFNYKLLRTTEYNVTTTDKELNIKIHKNIADKYPFSKLLISDCFEINLKSDRDFLITICDLFNRYLTSSEISTSNLGALVAISPAANRDGFALPITEEERKGIENSFSANYGTSTMQSQVAIFDNPKKIDHISLSQYDKENWEKAINCIALIAGHFDLPASQLPILDISGGNALSNGGEIREGDILKYKTFERILRYYIEIGSENFTFNYKIKNKPVSETKEVI